MTSVSTSRLSNSSIESGMDTATPKRPVRAPARQNSSASKSTATTTSITAAAASSSTSTHVNQQHLQPRTLLFADTDRTPKKSSPLPTLPASESTSSGSGSGSTGGVSQRGLGLSQSISINSTSSTTRSRSNTTSSVASRSSPAAKSDEADSSVEKPRFNTLGRRKAADLRNGESSSSPSPSEPSRLHRKTSSMTIRSGSSSRDETPNRSISRAEYAASLSRQGSVTEPRQRKSAIYEQRSESRLGRRPDEERSASRLGREDEDETSLQDARPVTVRSSSQNLGSPPRRRERTSTASTTGGDSTTTDTSGTEGANSVVGRRRRKKSSASSRGKGNNSRKGRSSPARPTEEWARETSFSRNWPSGHSRMESDGDYPRNGFPSSSNSMETFPTQQSPRRALLPQEFKQPASASASTSRYRSDSMYSEEGEDDEEGSLSRTLNAGPSTGFPPRRRHASDAQPARIPTFEYQGRGGTKDSRLSVDSGAASKHLMRASSNGPDTLPTTSRSEEWGDVMSSPSEEARVRKVSLASSNSNSNSNSRSSGGHSDHRRSSSRISSRDFDVFGHGRGSPAPMELGEKMERARSKQDRLAALGFGSSKRGVGRIEFDELRSGIERLPLTDSYESGSRSPSLASGGSQPRSASSAQQFDYSQSRPSTEPRRPPRHAMTMDFPSDMSIRAREQAYNSSRGYSGQSEDLSHGQRNFSMPLDRDRAPMTPDTGPSRPDSVTRIVQSATIPHSSRFSSSSSAHGSAKSHGEEEKEHLRLLKKTFYDFDRYFSGGANGSANGTPPSANGSVGPEGMELVNNFAAVANSTCFINKALRELHATVLRASIAAETDNSYSSSEALVRTLEDLDKNLIGIRSQSDDQVRELSKGLLAFTRTEREKDRSRRATVYNESGSVGRPSSRMSSITHTTQQVSPRKPRDFDRSERTNSIDLRATMSSRAGRSSPTATADWVSGRDFNERAAANSSVSRDQSRRSTIGRSSGAIVSPTVYRNGGQEFPSVNSTTVASRARTSMNSHARSASEVNPQTSVSRRAGKSSNVSNTTSTTIKAPTSLSPRKPKLSFPSSSQSHATASFASGSSEADFDAEGSMDSAISLESDGISKDGSLPRSLAKALSNRSGETTYRGEEERFSPISRRNTLSDSRPSTRDRQTRTSPSQVLPSSTSNPTMPKEEVQVASKSPSSGSGSISRFFNSRSLGRSNSRRSSQILQGAEGEGHQSVAPTSRRGSRDLSSLTRSLANQ